MPTGLPTRLTPEACAALHDAMERGEIATLEQARQYLCEQWGIVYYSLNGIKWQFRQERTHKKTGRTRHIRSSAAKQDALKKLAIRISVLIVPVLKVWLFSNERLKAFLREADQLSASCRKPPHDQRWLPVSRHSQPSGSGDSKLRCAARLRWSTQCCDVYPAPRADRTIWFMKMNPRLRKLDMLVPLTYESGDAKCCTGDSYQHLGCSVH